MDARIFEWFAKNWWVVIFYVGFFLGIKLFVLHAWIRHQEKKEQEKNQEEN